MIEERLLELGIELPPAPAPVASYVPVRTAGGLALLALPAQKLFGTQGVVDLVLTCSYYTAINIAQVALKPEMEAGKKSTL